MSVGVVLAGGLYLWQGWIWIDPVVSLAIALAIVVGTWSLFRQSLHLLFEGVPEHIDLPSVRQRLLDLPGVQAVHDLHVWAMDTSEVALTAHLVLKNEKRDSDALLHVAADELHEHFDIRHVTLQLESEKFAFTCDPGSGKSC
ncbi:MAG: cation diffusion facilitator family transporter [Edaphobacter sp.]